MTILVYQLFFFALALGHDLTRPFPHSPDYVADDSSILVGVEAMLACYA